MVIDKKVAHAGLVGAAGYMGLLVWHSGLSGSAPLKVAEDGHLLIFMKKELIATGIDIDFRYNFTSWNIGITVAVMVAIVGLFAVLGRHVENEEIEISDTDLFYSS